MKHRLDTISETPYSQKNSLKWRFTQFSQPLPDYLAIPSDHQRVDPNRTHLYQTIYLNPSPLNNGSVYRI